MANMDEHLDGCTNCAYRTAPSNVPPCSECEHNGGEENRFVDEHHKCGNCKYCNVPSHQHPCLQCMTDCKGGAMLYSHWEAPKDETPQDTVNHPSHYEQSCSLECIEAMEIIFGVETVVKFCTLNAFKYIWRWKHKNGQEDLKKAKWYICRVIEYYANSCHGESYDDDWEACKRILNYIEGVELRKE